MENGAPVRGATLFYKKLPIGQSGEKGEFMACDPSSGKIDGLIARKKGFTEGYVSLLDDGMGKFKYIIIMHPGNKPFSLRSIDIMEFR